MRVLAGLLVVLAVAAAGAAVWYLGPWSDDDEQAIDLSELDGELSGSACRRVAGVAARIAAREPAPVQFLRDLGRQVAGIRPPPRGIGDLARGGSNRIAGKGFLARFDDGSQGQARHFAGIAVATTYFDGASRIRWISENVRNDPGSSADGLLTDEGIAFGTEVLKRDLSLERTPEWLLEHLCRRS
ncbi:MAG: hypothetical protein ACXWZW_08680 [Solirubrobacterales bacterium]